MYLNDSLLLQAGVQNQQSGRFQEAENCFRQVLAAHPRHAEASFLLGGLTNQVGRGDLALPLLRTAVEVDPGQTRYLIALGNLLLQQGSLEEALKLFTEGIRNFPDKAELHTMLGSVFLAKNQDKAALASYLRALELNPNLMIAHAKLGLLQYQLGQNEEAIAAGKRAIALKPTHAASHATIGLALVKQGKLAEGIASLQRALVLQPNLIQAQAALAGAYLQAGDPAAALRTAQESRASLGSASGILAFEYLALNELGDDAGARQLMDFDRQIYFESLPIPSEYSTLEEFNKALAAEMRAHPSLIWGPALKTTRGGYLSANLNDQPTPIYKIFERQVRKKIDDFIQTLPVDPLHPLFGRKSSKYQLIPWATILDENGHQESHLHAGAWFSGVYYVELPRTLGSTAQDNTGWIEFGRPPTEYDLQRPPMVKTIQPRTGFMVLFPSLLFHRTIPFPPGGQRISIAFDIVV